MGLHSSYTLWWCVCRKYKDANLLGQVDDSEDSPNLPTAVSTRAVIHKEAVEEEEEGNSEEEMDTGEIRRYAWTQGKWWGVWGGSDI